MSAFTQATPVSAAVTQQDATTKQITQPFTLTQTTQVTL